jgi:DNA-binding SARP family transcriptional activator
MDDLRICLFGGFDVRRGEQVVSGLHGQKLQELFSYLLLNRARSIPRESLAGLLWDDRATPQSRKHLRQALWQLQTALDPASEPCRAPVLLVEPDSIRVNQEVGLWLDVAVFEEAFASAQGVLAQQFDAPLVQRIQAAVQLYQGDLLVGRHQEWCLGERERLQNMYLTMLDKLTSYFGAHREYETALEHGARLLRCDPACERTHRRMMRLHYLTGDRTAALRQYDRCAAALAEALGAKPGKRTWALYQQIRADSHARAPGGGDPAPTLTEPLPHAELTTASLPVTPDYLKQLRMSLSHLQQQVQQAIHTIELVLPDDS